MKELIVLTVAIAPLEVARAGAATVSNEPYTEAKAGKLEDLNRPFTMLPTCILLQT